MLGLTRRWLVDGLAIMTWEKLVDVMTASHVGVVAGKMFGLPCLKRADGKVIAALSGNGGIIVKLLDADVRAEALSRPGVRIAAHAFDPTRLMQNWVHVPRARSAEWPQLIERALRD